MVVYSVFIAAPNIFVSMIIDQYLGWDLLECHDP